eukprot:543413-Pelagomonas_calceolata.AAC.4
MSGPLIASPHHAWLLSHVIERSNLCKPRCCCCPFDRAHYELFIRALDAPNVREGSVCLVHPTVGPTQDDDIPGAIRYKTYEVGHGCQRQKASSQNDRLLAET